ncbi:MAG: glycosyltransferase family 39 protein [Acidobacteria bacterium]|nr:glycosyltransferase family 39 protein [Acidobacteriota bacterium]
MLSNWARRLAPLLALLILYPAWTTAFGLYGPDEPRYAAIAREMAQSGDWVVPKLDGEAWLEKPPLLYWMSAIGFRLGLGPEAAPRLPLALASVSFLIWFRFYLRRWLTGGQALLAVCILATSAGWIAYSYVAVTDVPLSICFAVAMLVSLAWIEDGKARDAWVAGVFFGLAILAKALVPVALAAPLVWFARGRWRQWPIVAGAALVVAGPWYAAMVRREGWAFIDELFVKHHFSRFVSADLQHVQPFWFYVPVLIGFLVPWPLLLIHAPWKEERWRYLVVWFAFGFVVFSAGANKLPGYLLPLLPALAILMAVGVPQAARWPYGLAAAVTVVILAVKLFVAPVLDPQVTARALSGQVTADACAERVPRSLRYGLHYYAGRPIGDCWQMPGAIPVPAGSLPAPRQARYSITHTAASPLSGRLLVFGTTQPPVGGIVLPSDDDPARVWIASREVLQWPAGQAVILDPMISAFPGAITATDPARFYFTVVFDPEHDFPYGGLSPGDLRSDLITIDHFDPKADRVYSFALTRGSGVTRPPKATVEVMSALLSRFHHQPVTLRADVVPGTGGERVLVLHAFGETLSRSRLRTLLLDGKPRPTLIFLDCVYRYGHHAFTDSDVNGPWERALLEELLPALGRGAPPHLLGDGFGGWAAIHLKQAHPKEFGEAWAVRPDPLDFRNFFGIDLTAKPSNFFQDGKGQMRPFGPGWSIASSTLRENVLGPDGGRWESWEAVFGPRTSDGISRELFGRSDGQVDELVRNAWLRFNIAAKAWPANTRVITEAELPVVLQSK